MAAIKISVVIPTYKRVDLLANCLRALCRQTIDPGLFEIIVVSDGPDPASSETVMQLLQDKYSYSYISPGEKKGPAAARNLGWKQAGAPLIAFTDDDCLLDKDWLQSLLTSYKGEELVAFTGSITVPVSDRPTDFARNTTHLERAAFVTANCCLTKKALIHIGGFDERFMMAWREDSDLEFKLLSQSIPIRRIEKALVVHPVRKAPWGISIKEQRKGIFNALLYKKFPELYRSKIQPTPAWDYYAIVISFITCLIGFIIAENEIIIPSLLLWSLLMTRFIVKRLVSTSRSFGHVSEMIVTSLVIPFISVYWQLYGAIKYRVLFF